MPLASLTTSGRKTAGGSVALATPDITGKIYTVAGLKVGSTATLYGNGSSLGTATVNSAGRATWTLANRPADGVIITYDGVVTGSGGTVAPSPVAISGTPGQALVGQAYFWAPTVTGGSGTKVYTLSAGPLPAGLSLNSNTGAITGTPTAPGTTSDIAITVTDSSGSATLSGLSFTAVAVRLAINNTIMPVGDSRSEFASAVTGDANGSAPTVPYNGIMAAVGIDCHAARYLNQAARPSVTINGGRGGDTTSASTTPTVGLLARTAAHLT